VWFYIKGFPCSKLHKGLDRRSLASAGCQEASQDRFLDIAFRMSTDGLVRSPEIIDIAYNQAAPSCTTLTSSLDKMAKAPTYSAEDLPAIKKLLKELCTRKEVEDLLRAKRAPFSAARKEDVVDTRLQQALDENRLGIADAVALLRDAEEHGRQHILLLRCSETKAGELLEEVHVREGLKGIGAASALDEPRVLDITGQATITEARLELFPKGQPKALVIKQVVPREKLLAAVKVREGNEIISRTRVEITRGVNVVRLHSDGLLEVRLEVERQADYQTQRMALLKLLDPLLPQKEFTPISLEAAKTYMWDHRNELKDDYRLWWAKARGSNGDSAVFATSEPNAHLCDRPGQSEGLAAFMNGADAVAASWVALFRTAKPGDDDDEVELRVVIGGEENEFYVTAQCSGPQYEHVLAKLRQYNG
jgi:hypothetical protein